MRPVVLGTLFGALMLLALAAGVLAAVGRTPRAASAVVVLLWIVAGIVLVVGAGLTP
jgi:ABC-type Na+ efflux pump permease subunit